MPMNYCSNIIIIIVMERLAVLRMHENVSSCLFCGVLSVTNNQGVSACTQAQPRESTFYRSNCES